MNDFGLIYAPWTFNFGQIFSLLLLAYYYTSELKKGETFASLLNIHGRDICVVPTHLVYWLGAIGPVLKSQTAIGEKTLIPIYLFILQICQ